MWTNVTSDRVGLSFGGHTLVEYICGRLQITDKRYNITQGMRHGPLVPPTKLKLTKTPRSIWHVLTAQDATVSYNTQVVPSVQRITTTCVTWISKTLRNSLMYVMSKQVPNGGSDICLPSENGSRMKITTK
jgi:hypothetical protein